MLTALLFFSAQTLLAQVYYVSPNGNGSGSGDSWANASTLQNAVANAQANDEIWLRQGTYNISSTLSIDKTLQILGGYSGTGNQRDPNTFPSIINGQNSSVMVQTGYSSDNTLFDGISFINGYARPGDVDADDFISGGAMYIAGNGTRINNCIFRNNTSENRIGSGAIYLWSVDDILIENSLFENNRVIQNGQDDGNMGGGALHIRFGLNNRLENCRFINNSSHYNGGAIFAWGENVQLVNCHFEDNHSNQRGGAVYVNFDDIHVSNSTFLNNSSAGSGGAIGINSDASTVSNSIFSQNASHENGGAIYSGSVLSVSNSLFNSNTVAQLGGGIYSREILNVANSTFVSNTNTAIIHPRSASTTFSTYETKIYNSIFHANTPASISGTTLWADVDRNFNGTDQSTRDFKRNIFQENTHDANNLTAVDPAFQDFSNGNFRLSTDSPAIDYGNNALYNTVSMIPSGSSTDLDDGPRVFGAGIDLGAYEQQSAPTLTEPGCVTTMVPTNNAVNVPVDSNISWNAVDLAIGYHIAIGTAPGGTEVVDNVQVSGTTYDPTTDFNGDTIYYLRVIPYNTIGNAMGCGEFVFTTLATATVPGCTSLSNPMDGATDVPLSADLNWATVTGATGYRLRIGTTPNGNELLPQTDMGPVTTYDPGIDFPEGTDIYVRIVPYNAEGDAMGCTVERFATEVLPTIPDCTTITFPTDGSTDVDTSTNISWEAVGNANNYLVRVGTISGGTDIVDNHLVTGTGFDLPDDLMEGTLYFLNVIPTNGVGQAMGCDEISFVTETSATVPACTPISVDQNGGNLTIGWDAVVDADDYQVTIGSVPAGDDILTTVVTGTSFTDQLSLVGETTYYLNIVPRNEHGPAENCGEVSFTTGVWPTIPDCTTISFPTDGSTDVNVSTGIRWGVIGNADNYLVSIGTEPGGTNVVNNVSVSGTNFDIPGDLMEATTYYARVISINGMGQALGCTEISFTTEHSTAVPECANLMAPNHESTNVALNTIISWADVDMADGYFLSIGTSPGGTEIVDNVQVWETSYQVSGGFEERTTYYVSVVPYNTAGTATACPGIRFTTTEGTFFKTRYGISPNGDGNNDFWNIPGIEDHPENVVSLHNRWGDMVFQVKGYNNQTQVFNGKANRLSSIGAGTLPEGTYFFQIQFEGPDAPENVKGFLVLKR